MPIKLENFKEQEFEPWFIMMSPRLLTLLDLLRFKLGTPIYISAHPKALGRNLGLDSLSEHNIDRWGEVQAADCFISGVYTTDMARKVVTIATSIGFTGIGVYTDTTNNFGESQVMFHFGVRSRRKMGDPATWGRIEGRYVSIESALNALEDV